MGKIVKVNKTNTLKNNFIWSTFYQIFTMVTPLITAPYISRVLGANGIGIYSYTNSIQAYFVMFATLGTASYGVREISRERKNIYKRSRLFWEIELLTVITTGVCLVAWGIWIILSQEYEVYYLLWTCNLIAVMFDISWFFSGLECFKEIVRRNIIFKLIGIGLLFSMVKKQEDVAIYIGILTITNMISNLSMWLYLPKYLVRINYSEVKPLHHIRETMVYFIPTVATSIYTILDRTLLGLITGEIEQNGYYEQAAKIINMAKGLTFSSLNAVLGARLSFLFKEMKYDEIRNRIRISIDYILFIGIGFCFGITGIAESFIPFFFGQGYEESIGILQCMSPLIVIVGISNCLGSHYYTPAGFRKKSSFYIVIGACVNFILNLFFIPIWKGYGAVFASVIAELLITILYVYNCNDYLRVSYIVSCVWKKAIVGVIMGIVVYIVGKWQCKDIYIIMLQILIGVGVYVGGLFLIKDTFLQFLILQFNIYYKKDKKKNG